MKKTWDLSGREFVLLGEMLPHTVHLWELLGEGGSGPAGASTQDSEQLG